MSILTLRVVYATKWLVAVAVAWVLVGSAIAQTPSSQQQAYESAVQDPDNDAKVDAFLATLPKVDDTFIVESDLAMSRRDVIRYLNNQAFGEDDAQANPELRVNKVGGRRDYWVNPKDRHLTYWIKKTPYLSDAHYQQVRAEMVIAAKDWESICPHCGITFTEVNDGSNASFNIVVTTIPPINGSRIIATAFFPSCPKGTCNLNLDEVNYFAYQDRIGALRHELGHVLGYRHEHSGAPGCGWEREPSEKITAYDKESVMHYPCGPKVGRSLVFSETDISGHRALYGQKP